MQQKPDKVNKRTRESRTSHRLIAIAPAPSDMQQALAIAISVDGGASTTAVPQRQQARARKESPKKTDTRERNFVCPSCERRYLTRTTLRKHIMQCHEMEKPNCIYCRRPIRQDNMARHHHEHCRVLREVRRAREREEDRIAKEMEQARLTQEMEQAAHLSLPEITTDVAINGDASNMDLETWLAQEAIRIVSATSSECAAPDEVDIDLLMNFVMKAEE